MLEGLTARKTDEKMKQIKKIINDMKYYTENNMKNKYIQLVIYLQILLGKYSINECLV
jgi:hypothetical protein